MVSNDGKLMVNSHTGSQMIMVLNDASLLINNQIMRAKNGKQWFDDGSMMVKDNELFMANSD